MLVTGAAGRIGRGFAEAVAGRFELRLTDRPEADTAALEGFGNVRPCRLDLPAPAASSTRSMIGVDEVEDAVA